MKKIVALTLLLCLLCSAVSCTVTPRETTPGTKPTQASTTSANEPDAYLLVNGEKLVPEYVMEVNGTKISFAEFRYNYLYEKEFVLGNLSLEEAKEYWTEENEKKLLDTVIDNIKKDQSLLQYAAQNNIALTEAEKKEIADNIEDMKDATGESTMLKQLQSMYIADFDFYRELVERNQLINGSIAQYFYGENGTRVWDDKKIESYMQEKFQCSLEEYYQKNYLCAKHILIEFQEGEDSKSHEKTLTAINAVYDKVQKGESFDDLIQEYGEDPGMSANPNGYVFTDGEMVDEFYEGTKALEPGQYSKPIMTSYGFHIILRLPLTAEGKETAKQAVLFGDSETPGAYQDDFSIYAEELEKAFSPTVTLNPEIADYINHDSVF